MKNQIAELINNNNKLRAERGTYEMRITELETTISNLDNILTAKGIEYEGIHNLLSSNKGTLEVTLQENIQLRNQLNFSEERYQSTETERIDAMNKVAELQHFINRLNDEKVKMEAEIVILKNQNFEFSQNTKITIEDFNAIRRQFSEIQARYQVDTKRFKDRKAVLEDEIRRVEDHLNKARNQVCEEKRLREEADSQLKSIIEDLNIEREKNVNLLKENQILKNELEKLRIKLQGCFNTIEELKSKLGDGMTSVTDLKNQLNSYLAEISSLKSKLSAANNALELEKQRSEETLADYKKNSKT